MNNKYVEKLGLDRLKKAWYVLIDETDKSNAHFYVFSEENQGKDIEWKAFHDLEAVVIKSGEKEVILAEFNHVSYNMSYHGPAVNLLKRTNKENRGIGTLLLKRIEAWSITNGFKIIRGFLRHSDNIEKLKYFFSKMGWTVEIPAKTRYTHPEGIPKGIGMVYKRLKK